MNNATKKQFEDLHSKDDNVQGDAYRHLMQVTDKPVNWAYEVWDELEVMLTSPDNHERAIAGQLLSNLAKSDPKNRMRKTFPKLLTLTKDERFVTARHTMQNLWKVGAVDNAHQKMLLDGMAYRFDECKTERNCTLIRYDILVGLHNLYNQDGDAKIKTTALALMETEDDLKYKKKYATAWRGA